MPSLIAEVIKLTVPEYIPVGLAGFLAGLVFSSRLFVLDSNVTLGLLCVTLVIAGYDSFNAIADVEIDKINKPQRPLARKTLEKKHALSASSAFFFLALLISYAINITFFDIVVVAVVLSILYSLPGTNLKRRIGLGTFVAAALYTILFPLAGWAVMPANPIPLSLIAYLFLFGIGIATLKDFEDIIGDSRYDAHTPVNYLGYSKALNFISIVFILSVILLLFLVVANIMQLKYAGITLLAVPALLNVRILHKNRTAKAGRNAFRAGMLILMLVETLFIILSII